jgi:hypothetical protein
MVTGSVHDLPPSQRKLIGFGAAAAAIIGAMAIVATLTGATGAPFAVALVLFGGIAATWITAFAR